MKILYVEDEIFLGKIVKETLESRGFEMLMISDGAEAVGAFHDFNPELCILDIMLPNLSGYEIAEKIRGFSPKMPIIFLTAKTQTEDVLKGFQVGGNDYLRKPFSMEELIVRIQNLKSIMAGGITAKEQLTLGAFVFYPGKLELRLPSGKIQKLSFREMELLNIFAENTNQKVLRKDILLSIWNDDSYFNSRNLDVYITKLRDYFKEDPNIEIMTLKGVGYIFKV